MTCGVCSEHERRCSVVYSAHLRGSTHTHTHPFKGMQVARVPRE